MASTGNAYPDPDAAQMGSTNSGYYIPNGDHQQQQVPPTDPSLQQLSAEQQEQLRNAAALMPSGPSPENQVQPFQTPRQSYSAAQSMAQTAMSVPHPAEAYSPLDMDGSKKPRSKVSRACDECRRKKIKCDSTGENGPQACSSCRRTGAECRFSRQPMKRGPSKGYIKELADRVSSLEGHMRHDPVGSDYSYVDDYSGNAGPHPFTEADRGLSRKRTFSQTDDFQYGESPSQRPFQPPGVSRQSFPRSTLANGDGQSSLYQQLQAALSAVREFEEAHIRQYMRHIHPVLPILWVDQDFMSHVSATCTPKLVAALAKSLECAVMSMTSTVEPSQCRVWSQLMEDAKWDGKDHPSELSDLVRLQSYCLMAVAAGYINVDVQRQFGLSMTGLLSDGYAISLQLGLNDQQKMKERVETDSNFAGLCRCVFWSLFILDRLHASSANSNLVLPGYCGGVLDQDMRMLGETATNLARVCDTIGQIVTVSRADTIPAVTNPNPLGRIVFENPLILALEGQLTRFRESIPNPSTDSPAYIALMYAQLLLAKLPVDAVASGVLNRAKDLVGVLASQPSPSSCLNNAFVSLAASSLVELTKNPSTADEAVATMGQLDVAVLEGRVVLPGNESVGVFEAIRNLLKQNPRMADLHSLATAAVTEREGADAGAPTNSGDNANPQKDPSTAEAAMSAVAAAQAANAIGLAGNFDSARSDAKFHDAFLDELTQQGKHEGN